MNEDNRKLKNTKSKFPIAALGDFNMEPTNQLMTTFMAVNDFINIIKSNTCFKTSGGTCIGLMLTTKSKKFQNTTK